LFQTQLSFSGARRLKDWGYFGLLWGGRLLSLGGFRLMLLIWLVCFLGFGLVFFLVLLFRLVLIYGIWLDAVVSFLLFLLRHILSFLFMLLSRLLVTLN